MLRISGYGQERKFVAAFQFSERGPLAPTTFYSGPKMAPEESPTNLTGYSPPDQPFVVIG